jgi:hypothetical protein
MKLEEVKTRILYGESRDNLQNLDPITRLTMLPKETLENIEFCLNKCIEENIPGDFVETGVWRGGACIFAREILKEKKENRKVYVCDSFEGLPFPDAVNYPRDAGDAHYSIAELSVGLEKVKENFEIFGSLDENVVFVKGWFKDTMKTIDVDSISVLRLDGDMYESTIQVLEALYPKLSVGGYCIIDDWEEHFGARYATENYRKEHNIEDLIEEFGRSEECKDCPRSIFWKKS